MAYDLNTDYQAIMNAAKASGDTAAYNAAAASRQEKINAASGQQLSNWGVSGADVATANQASANKIAAQQAAIAAQQQALVEAKKQAAIAQLVNKRNSAIGAINTEKANTTTSLANAKNTAISNLDAQKAKIEPTYYNMRNSAASQSQLNAKSLAEYMAQRGQTNSNLAVQSEMNRQNNLNNQLGTLNNNEAQNMADIEAKKADTANSYENSIANANSNANSAISQADQAYAQDVAAANNGLDSTYLTQALQQSQQDLANYRTDLLNAQSRQDALTQQDFQNNLASKQLEFQQAQAQRDATYKEAQAKIQNDLETRKITLEEAQQKWAQAQSEKQYLDQQAQQAWENTYKTNAFNNTVTQQNADNAYKYAALTASQKKASTGTPTVKDYYNDLQGMLTATTTNASNQKVPAYNQDQILERIKSLPLTADEKAYLANALGLNNSSTSTSSNDPYYNQGGYTTYLGGR